MKRAYLVNGNLVSTASTKDNIIRVDDNTYTYLSGLLGLDYCYLRLGKSEIIKVLGFNTPNILLVQRGVDNSDIVTHITGESLGYIFTISELKDSTAYIGYSLNLSGLLYLDTEQNINYGPMTMQGLGGIDIKGSVEGFTIYDITDNVGCAASITPPEIPPLLQPYRIIDTTELRVTDDGSYREYV